MEVGKGASTVQSLGWEDSLEEGTATPLQYSCLENPMARGAWGATVYSVAKSWTGLKLLSTHACTVEAVCPFHPQLYKLFKSL